MMYIFIDKRQVFKPFSFKPALVSLSVDLVCSLVDDTHEMCFIVLFPQRGKQIFGFLFGEHKRQGNFQRGDHRMKPWL